MMSVGSIAFAAPWLLTALVLLPVIWWLLRVTPPAPKRIDFPPLRLLLGILPKEETPDRTPIWLLLMRMLAAALIILALAQPLLNPSGIAGSGPLLLFVDDGWGSARHWEERQRALSDALAQAEREGRPVRLIPTAPRAQQIRTTFRVAEAGRGAQPCRGAATAAVADRSHGGSRPPRESGSGTGRLGSVDLRWVGSGRRGRRGSTFGQVRHRHCLH